MSSLQEILQKNACLSLVWKRVIQTPWLAEHNSKLEIFHSHVFNFNKKHYPLLFKLDTYEKNLAFLSNFANTWCMNPADIYLFKFSDVNIRKIVWKLFKETRTTSMAENFQENRSVILLKINFTGDVFL